MKHDIIDGRRFDTGTPVRISIANKAVLKIEAIEKAPDNVWIAPALFDPQINGFAGVDFQRDDVTLDELTSVARRMREAACGQFFYTLTTEAWPVLLGRLARAKALREQSKDLTNAIAGWHVEGPFMSAAPGFHGAHDPTLMLDPTPERIRDLRAVVPDDPLLITISPERNGAIEAIALAVSLGMRVSLGHTDASAETLDAAVKAGATGYTHLGNGCTQALDRHDNIVLRMIDNPGLCASVIPDAIHVSPPMFRLMHSALVPGQTSRVCYTTDAMSAAGAPPGRYRIGKVETEVGSDRIVRMPGKTNFAGSALRPIDGVFIAADMLRCSWRETWARASLGARRYAGLSLKQDGAPFCIVTIEGNEFKHGRLFANGDAIEIRRTI